MRSNLTNLLHLELGIGDAVNFPSPNWLAGDPSCSYGVVIELTFDPHSVTVLATGDKVIDLDLNWIFADKRLCLEAMEAFLIKSAGQVRRQLDDL